MNEFHIPLPPGRLIRITKADWEKHMTRRPQLGARYVFPDCSDPLRDDELPPVVVLRARELGMQNGFLLGRRRHVDVTGAQWIAIREFVFERDGYRCAYCGAFADQIDHLIAVTKFGSWHPDNCVSCCRPCNSSKGNLTADEWSGRHESRYPEFD